MIASLACLACLTILLGALRLILIRRRHGAAVRRQRETEATRRRLQALNAAPPATGPRLCDNQVYCENAAVYGIRVNGHLQLYASYCARHVDANRALLAETHPSWRIRAVRLSSSARLDVSA